MLIVSNIPSSSLMEKSLIVQIGVYISQLQSQNIMQSQKDGVYQN